MKLFTGCRLPESHPLGETPSYRHERRRQAAKARHAANAVSSGRSNEGHIVVGSRSAGQTTSRRAFARSYDRSSSPGWPAGHAPFVQVAATSL